MISECGKINRDLCYFNLMLVYQQIIQETDAYSGRFHVKKSFSAVHGVDIDDISVGVQFAAISSIIFYLICCDCRHMFSFLRNPINACQIEVGHLNSPCSYDALRARR